MPQHNLRQRTSSNRRGAASRAGLLLVGSAVVLAALVFLLSRGNREPEELTIFCAAGLRAPMEDIRQAYATERGVKLTIQYGGSNTLLANLKLGQPSDLFLPADDSYVELAKQDGAVAETFAIAQMRPVVAVKKGNPLAIQTLDDLLTKNVRISMTEPSAAATGKLVKQALESAGKWEVFKNRVTVFKASVSEVAADLQVGAADAGIVWDAMLEQLTDFEAAPLPEFKSLTARVAVGVTAKTKEPAAALALAKYLSSVEKGQRFFADAGFTPAGSAEQAR